MVREGKRQPRYGTGGVAVITTGNQNIALSLKKTIKKHQFLRKEQLPEDKNLNKLNPMTYLKNNALYIDC